MTSFPHYPFAQFSVGLVLNALPEGVLITLLAWATLRVFRKQNAGTRFAVWFVALLAVAGLPLLALFGGEMRLASSRWSANSPPITIPGQWALLALSIWTVGVFAGIVSLLNGLWRLNELRRNSVPIIEADLDPVIRNTFDAIRNLGSFALSSVSFVTSDALRVPAAIGLWKRTIVLPSWVLLELPPEDLKVILLHEFAHLRRWDDWTNLIQKIVRILFFFHPAVWWIESQLSVEREMACDDAVLAETSNPRGYAACLVSLLEKALAHKALAMAQAAVHRARETSLRLARILDGNRKTATRISKPVLAAVGAFLIASLMALPFTPQFVAFDSGMTNGSFAADSVANSEPPSQASLGAARIVPAALKISEPIALRTGESTAPALFQSKSAHVHTVKVGHSLSARPATVPANLPVTTGEYVTINANANNECLPTFRTLVFIEATEIETGGPAPVTTMELTKTDSIGITPRPVSAWRVQIWRVTVVNAVLQQTTKIPAPHSI